MKKWIILTVMTIIAFQAGQAMACVGIELESKSNPTITAGGSSSTGSTSKTQ